jgi:hypothetical protein
MVVEMNLEANAIDPQNWWNDGRDSYLSS